MKTGHKAISITVLCLFVIFASARNKVYYLSDADSSVFPKDTVADTTNRANQPQVQQGASKLVEIKWADLGEKRLGFVPQILIGNVKLYHDGAYLYCDSAYYDDVSNTFEAFSNVRMEQGDTLFLYGNYMHYDGNTQLAIVRENVRMENVNDSATLFTDSLNYDRLANIGYYFDGGMLVDPQNELVSYWGQYEPHLHMALFTDSVELTNPKFKLYSDTLHYDTEKRIALISSPTRIVSDSGTIYTSNGWYNTATEESLLLDQSTIVNHTGDRILKGDSILYHRGEGYGEVFGNMFLQDTLKKVILQGQYGLYNEKTEYAMATDSAFCIEYSQGDSLYMHADTLKMIPDSIFKEIKAYYGVRFYRSDLQGVCDSLQFNSRDSILHMYKNPVLWNEKNQVYGETINVYMNDSTVDYIHVMGYSFSVQDVDSIHYNQMKGRSMKAYVENGTMRRVLVEGNAESVFYPQEDDGNMVGLNWLESSYMDIYLLEGKLEKIKAWPAPVGKMTPMFLIKPDQLRLSDFYWYDYLRPLNKDDIFRRVAKKSSDIRAPRSKIFDLPAEDSAPSESVPEVTGNNEQMNVADPQTEKDKSAKEKDKKTDKKEPIAEGGKNE